MKRTMTLSIALLLVFAMLSLMTSDSKAQRKPRFRAETGTIGPLGPDQSLRINVVSHATESVTFNFAEMEYAPGPCDGNVCQQMLASQTSSGPIQLDPNQGASVLVNSTLAVRVIMMSNSPNVQVNAVVFDTSTQRVVAMFQTEMLQLN
jgi:hypothetical protein